MLPSVVKVNVTGQSGGGTGSGIILTKDGQILTNNHVVSGVGSDPSITVNFNDGTTKKAKVIGTDPLTDIAVIKAEDVDDLTPATLGKSSALQVGQTVVAARVALRAERHGHLRHRQRPEPAGLGLRRGGDSPGARAAEPVRRVRWPGGAGAAADPAQPEYDVPRDPDRRRDQPRQLRWCPGRHVGPRGRHQLLDPYRERLQRIRRLDRPRLRDPDRRGAPDRQPDHRQREADARATRRLGDRRGRQLPQPGRAAASPSRAVARAPRPVSRTAT